VQALAPTNVVCAIFSDSDCSVVVVQALAPTNGVCANFSDSDGSVVVVQALAPWQLCPIPSAPSLARDSDESPQRALNDPRSTRG
jgi:hypothetical protein